MSDLIADLFVTVRALQLRGAPRGDLSALSLRSLKENTNPKHYRLTICVDGAIDFNGTPADLFMTEALGVKDGRSADYFFHSKERVGLGPTVNRVLYHLISLNEWWESSPESGAADKVAPYIVYCQDDLFYKPNWLPTLAKRFHEFGKRRALGFASGLECIEHPVRETLQDGSLYKDHIRAAHMMAKREYWKSMLPIPSVDGETGRARAMPNNGMGSGVDWHFIRQHENSVEKTGRTCLVMPGLVLHAGYKRSTWLDREMPESESDKLEIERIENLLKK